MNPALTNRRWLTLSAYVAGVALATLAAINSTALLLALCLVSATILAVSKRALQVVFVSPFLAISLMPSQFSSAFRFASPLGELRADFLLLLGAITVFMFVSASRKHLRGGAEFGGLLTATAVFFAVNVVSILINDLGFDSFRYSFFVFLFSFGTLLLVAFAHKTIDAIRALRSFAIISTAVSALGVLEFLGIFRPFTALYVADNPWFSYVEGSGNLRIASSIGNPLVLSGYLLLMLPISIFLREKSNNKPVWSLAVMLHVLALLLTQSRSAYLVMAAMLLYYSTKNVRSFVTYTSIVGVVAFAFYSALNLFGLTQGFIDRLLFRTESESFSIRSDAFTVALELIKEMHYMVIGLGPNQVNDRLNDSFVQIATLDNVFLMTVVSLGIAGLLAYVAILVVAWKKFSRADESVKRAGFSLLIATVGLGFSFNVTYFTAVWGVFWLLASVLLVYSSTLENSDAKDGLGLAFCSSPSERIGKRHSLD